MHGVPAGAAHPAHPFIDCRYSGRTVSKLAATLAAGAAIGASAQVMQLLIEAGVQTHNQLLQQVWGVGRLYAFGVELFITLCLVITAGAMVLLFAPRAAGGGVAVSGAMSPAHHAPNMPRMPAARRGCHVNRHAHQVSLLPATHRQ